MSDAISRDGREREGKRIDAFAAAALTGILSNPENRHLAAWDMAEWAASVARYMVKELDK